MSPERVGEGPRTSYLVARLDRLVRSQLSEVLEPFDLSVPQYTLLSVLEHRPGLSNAQLARRSYITAQAMHQVVNGLEERGLIARRVSPVHGRIQLTELTDEGLDLLKSCDEEVTRLEERIFGGLGEKGEERLRRLIQAAIDFDSPEG
ncbi:MAG TPA: MarR family transcriptional regulator [Acidimicrobiia bacterium]|nr:MarR family transcriptional regulator [Acidimicrobiia bacterium]